MDEETKGQAEYTAYYMWSMDGYNSYFEPNGVSFETFTKYTVNSYYPSLYFKHLYAEGGEKEISSADVEKKLYDDFIIADLIDVTFDKETDKEKAEIKSELDAYVKDLNSGKKTFEEVYNDYNEVKEEEESKEETAESETENTDNSRRDTTATHLQRTTTIFGRHRIVRERNHQSANIHLARRLSAPKMERSHRGEQQRRTTR